jgi:uncharacterized membrane protein
MQTHYNTLAGSEVGRIAALSDGLFAIAATILVLDFHTPEPTDIHSEADLLRALATSAPRLLPWLLSLLTLGIFWLGQQTQLSQLERSTWVCAERANLIRGEARGDISRTVKRRIVVAQSLYAIGALAGLINVTLGITLIMLIQLNYAIGPRLPILSRL